MRKKIRNSSLLSMVILLMAVSGYSQHTNMKMVVDYKLPTHYPISFALVNQLGGYIGNRYKVNLENRLLKVDEEGLLDGFVNRPGKHRWIGEHIGKYLEAAANTWEITRDVLLKTQMDRMAHRLMATQTQDGYLGTYIPENYWTSWDVWSHKYDMYGLLAYYRVTGSQDALNTCVKIGNLIVSVFGTNSGQRNILKSGSHVGMAATSILDPMLDLYMWTGDKKYLEFGKYIIKSYDFEGGPAIVKTLLKEKRVDKVANAKAYEMLSNIVGLVKMYRLTGDEELGTIVSYAFDDIVANRLFVTGTSSDHERFRDNDYLLADTSAHMGEGCVTTTWIQFNMQMFSLTGDMKFYNEIEKSYYNHLLGAENPITGCVSYYTPLIGEKPYACHITCCLSSVPRGIALGPYLNYGKLDCSPTILLYESASIMDSVKTNNGKMINLNLKMDSKFPHEGYAKIKVGLSSSASFALQLRNPVWCKRFRIKINGQAHPINSHNQLSVVERKWKSGDIVEVFFDIPILRVDGKSSYTGYFALKRGPQMLALDYSLNRNIDLKNAKWSLTKMEDYKVANHKKNLPSQWIGDQLYNISLQDSNGTSQQLALVPYADASQTGGFTDLWIKGISTK